MWSCKICEKPVVRKWIGLDDWHYFSIGCPHFAFLHGELKEKEKGEHNDKLLKNL